MTKKKKKSPPEGIPESIQVTDTLDLHGFFPQQIPEMIESFIENAIELNLCRLRIIHGKGKSRIKYEAYQVLKNHPCVIKFYDAPPDSGGWGVTIVEIK
jgi:DNA mismatch repair protein MutS2